MKFRTIIDAMTYINREELKALFQKEADNPDFLAQGKSLLERAQEGFKIASEQGAIFLAIQIGAHREGDHGENWAEELGGLEEALKEEYRSIEIEQAPAWWYPT